MKHAALALGLLALAGCSREPLPVLGRVPAFALTAHTGREFHADSLRGKIWVANFMFTHCLGPCPRMSSQMHWVQNRLSDVPDARFVSFTVDPGRDTPEVLAAYAAKFQAAPGRWFFLTGSRQTLDDLDRNAFKLGNVDGSLQHSTRFVLVDRQGRIRGYYDTTEQGVLDRVVRDVRRLEREASQ